MESVVAAAISGVFLVFVALIGRDARAARRNTDTNGHGLVVKDAVGEVIDSVKRVEAKVDRVISWVGQHQVEHALQDALARAEAAERRPAE